MTFTSPLPSVSLPASPLTPHAWNEPASWATRPRSSMGQPARR